MGRRVMAVFAAVVVGLIGVAAVLVYAGAADSRAIVGQRLQRVFIAAKLVPSGTSAADAVTQGLIVPTQVSVKGVPPGVLSKVDNATGKLLALNDIAPGEFVLSSRFGTTPLGQSAIAVPLGQVAISLTLADPARVGTFVTPGSHIVIYDTYSPTAAVAPGAKQTRVLLDDVLVIAMGSTSLAPSAPAGGQAATSGGQAATPGALVTVALAPDTATKLVQGIQTGTLYAGLNGTNTKPNLSQIVTDSTLFTK
jgi:pilus assembly protein CpaB